MEKEARISLWLVVIDNEAGEETHRVEVASGESIGYALANLGAMAVPDGYELVEEDDELEEELEEEGEGS